MRIQVVAGPAFEGFILTGDNWPQFFLWMGHLGKLDESALKMQETLDNRETKFPLYIVHPGDDKFEVYSKSLPTKYIQL